MKPKHFINRLFIRLAAVLASLFAMAKPAFALTGVNLTQDQSNGVTLTTMANNVDSTLQLAQALAIEVFTFGGFLLIGVSFYALHKAAKDERERPTIAIVGLAVGGLLAAVGTVMWAIRNSII